MSKTPQYRIVYLLVIIYLMVFTVVNMYQTIPLMGSFSKGILLNIDMPGIWRGARFHKSDNFADYIHFLRENIPADGSVVLPPDEVTMWTLSDVPSMQFFLHPREVTNCNTLACGKTYLKYPNVYILVSGLSQFPGIKILDQPNNLRMYNDTWGVYATNSNPWDDDIEEKSIFQKIAVEIVFPIFFLVLLILGGFFILSEWIPEMSPWMRMGISSGIPLGLLSIAAYLFLLVFPLADIAWLGYLLFAIIMIGFLFGIWKGIIPFGDILQLVQREGDLDIWRLVIILFVGATLFISVGSGFHYGDGIVLWGAKGMGILKNGLDGVTQWGTNTTIYPLQIPLLIAVFESMFGHLIPISKAIFSLFFCGILLVMNDYLSRKTNGLIAGMGTIAYALLPLISLHSRIGYANLALTYYLMVGIVLLILIEEDSRSIPPQRLSILTGLSLLLAVWTRPEGITLVLSSLGVYLVTIAFSKKLTVHRKRFIYTILMPLTVFFVFWILSRRIFYLGIKNKTDSLVRAFEQILMGNFQADDFFVLLRFLGRQLISYQTWGIIGVGVLILIGSQVVSKKILDLPNSLLLLVGTSLIIVMMAVYYTFAFDNQHDMSWWLNSGFNRMIIPGVSLLYLGMIGSFAFLPFKKAQ